MPLFAQPCKNLYHLANCANLEGRLVDPIELFIHAERPLDVVHSREQGETSLFQGDIGKP